ncbi:hypothetical protein KI809_09370 [Geobacter pelophilus]|uniref:PLD-like domain-containing protein n=1 Tax=Geoanaerobacter pelophilus TaxID=60036 RepID=A0AAW4L653_9BACT|nr:hypothetical protein [Geoanaerobacter pelophilus]MBT0664508.1 hypothetical protein [Geoanaerobacter pelophilus]
MAIRIFNDKHGISVQNFLERAIDVQFKEQQKHEFWILTTAIDVTLIEPVIKSLQESIPLTDIYLAFDISQIPEAVQAYSNEALWVIKSNLQNSGINFEFTSLKHHKHAMNGKGYAIIQRCHNKITEGLVVITSADFTKAGFCGKNVELGHHSTTKKDLRAFEDLYKYLVKKLGCEVTTSAKEPQLQAPS